SSSYQFPSIPGFVMSTGHGASIVEARMQTERAMAMGHACTSIFRGLWNVLCRFDRALGSARTMNSLLTMNDRALADIGISRSEIPSIIAGNEFDEGIESAVTRYVYSVTSDGMREKHLPA
ncbi:MAG: DUF1127 domain-containing protein, partial [Alphaproteobacteria bacterium]